MATVIVVYVILEAWRLELIQRSLLNSDCLLNLEDMFAPPTTIRLHVTYDVIFISEAAVLLSMSPVVGLIGRIYHPV